MADFELYYPGAELRLLSGDEEAQPMGAKVWGFVSHTFVDAPGRTRMADYFDRPDVKAESTFVQEWPSGKLIQIMKCGQRVDTQVGGNRFHVEGVGYVGYDSVESEDEGNPEKYGYTDGMMNELADLMVWYITVQGVPMRTCRHSKDQGFGVHSMWGRENRFGPMNRGLHNPWTLAQGKTCPGNKRTSQWINEIWPEVQRRVKKSENQEEDEMRAPILIDGKRYALVDGVFINCESAAAYGEMVGAKIIDPDADPVAWRQSTVDFINKFANNSSLLANERALRETIVSAIRSTHNSSVDTEALADAILVALKARL